MRQSNQAYLASLNSAQLEAATHGEGPALVLAGPGSGKTTVIVKRILYLIKEMQIPPEEILVVTFTKDAAMSMQQRFAQQDRQTYPVNFGTFHSIFYHILMEAGYSPLILSQTRKKGIMTEILKQEAAKKGTYYDYDAIKAEADDFLRAIGFYKNTQDLEAAEKYLPNPKNSSQNSLQKNNFLEIFELYQRQCRIQGGLDFDDMLYECRRLLLENKVKREYWQNRFRYILIDEFQDINPLQYEVVKLLGERHGNLFAVGDDDQAIYGFRGSKPACLRQFATELGAKQIILNANYRSTGEIVAASELIIAENQDRFVKKCYAAGKLASTGDSIGFHYFESRARELNFLRDTLERVVKECPEESCGVLFRTNGSMQQLAAMLTRSGIPYEMKERGRNPYEHFLAKDICAYLKLAAGERRREDFLRIMNKPVRYISRECLAGMEHVDLQAMMDWYERRGRSGDEKIINEIQRFRGQLDAMGRMSLNLAIAYLCRAVGYETYLRSKQGAAEHLEEWLEIVEFLREDARGYDNVKQWEQAWKEYESDGKMVAGRGIKEGQSTIHLMTVHGSKGLEFDRVFIPDCNEKVYPHGRMPDRETVEEERRIFYVGMTRAKRRLELLSTTGTKERPRLLTRFLNPLVSHSSINSSNSQLSKYSSKASTTRSYSSSSSIKPSSGSSLGSSGFSL